MSSLYCPDICFVVATNFFPQPQLAFGYKLKSGQTFFIHSSFKSTLSEIYIFMIDQGEGDLPVPFDYQNPGNRQDVLWVVLTRNPCLYQAAGYG